MLLVPCASETVCGRPFCLIVDGLCSSFAVILFRQETIPAYIPTVCCIVISRKFGRVRPSSKVRPTVRAYAVDGCHVCDNVVFSLIFLTADSTSNESHVHCSK